MNKGNHEAALLRSYQQAISLNGRKNPNSLSYTEQVLTTHGVTLVLIGISALLFYKGTFFFGSLLSMLTYGYFVYGCFIAQPEVVMPYAYRSGSSWNAAKMQHASSVKQHQPREKINQVKRARYIKAYRRAQPYVDDETPNTTMLDEDDSELCRPNLNLLINSTLYHCE